MLCFNINSLFGKKNPYYITQISYHTLEQHDNIYQFEMN